MSYDNLTIYEISPFLSLRLVLAKIDLELYCCDLMEDDRMASFVIVYRQNSF